MPLPAVVFLLVGTLFVLLFFSLLCLLVEEGYRKAILVFARNRCSSFFCNVQQFYVLFLHSFICSLLSGLGAIGFTFFAKSHQSDWSGQQHFFPRIRHSFSLPLPPMLLFCAIPCCWLKKQTQSGLFCMSRLVCRGWYVCEQVTAAVVTTANGRLPQAAGGLEPPRHICINL